MEATYKVFCQIGHFVHGKGNIKKNQTKIYQLIRKISKKNIKRAQKVKLLISLLPHDKLN